MKFETNRILIVTISFLILMGLTCCKPNNNSNKLLNSVGFCEKFNKSFDDDEILLGCMIYSAKAQNKLGEDNDGEFSRVFSEFRQEIAPNETSRNNNAVNVDSLITNLIQRNSKINFYSDTCYTFVRRYVGCCHIVENTIYGKVESDADEDKLDTIQKRILKIAGLKIIYRYYIPEGADVSVLSHSGAAGLNFHIAYYLCLQNEDTREKIIRQLL